MDSNSIIEVPEEKGLFVVAIFTHSIPICETYNLMIITILINVPHTFDPALPIPHSFDK